MNADQHDGLDLSGFRAALSPHGILAAARRIQPGDEAAFSGSLETAKNLPRRQASGAARIAARRLLGEMGSDAAAPLRRSASGAASWPRDVVGSLSHSHEFALAAVASRVDILTLGVDIEPAEPLPLDILAFALRETERAAIKDDLVRARLIFASKEAVYKAVNALDGSPLEYGDIEVRLNEGRALLRDGREVRLIAHAGPRLMAAAFLPAAT